MTLFTRDGCNGVSICNNGFDWLNSNEHIAVFHTEAYRWAQKSVFLVGLKLILVPLKLILVALKLFLVPLKLFLVPLILFLVALKLFLVALKIQTFESNGTPYNRLYRISYFSCYQKVIPHFGATKQMPLFIPPESMITCVGDTNQMHWFILSGGHVQVACFLLFRRIFIILYNHCES